MVRAVRVEPCRDEPAHAAQVNELAAQRSIADDFELARTLELA
jgi:hypothetical protein